MIFIKPLNPNRLLIRGILSMAVGVTVIAVPDFSLKLMMQLLGCLLLADGVIALLSDYYATRKTKGYRLVPRGVSNLVIGIILLIFPALLVKVFVFVLGILLIFAGATQLMNQFVPNGKFRFSWLMALISAISLIAGILLVTRPFESAQTVLIMFGVVLFIYGIGEFIWSFKIRKLQKTENQQVIDTKYEEVD
jgi:uncharacterized membrane protein HdeD (DUF308 family)